MTETDTQQNIDDVNHGLIDTEVRLIGDASTIGEVIQLLAYIRHAIKSNSAQDINLKIGHNMVNSTFLFSVNNQDVPDLVAKSEYEIN